jgi:hypothetical protein
MSTADAALKNFYLDPVREQINNKNVLLEYVSKGKVDVEGRYAVLSLHTRRNGSLGARVDGADLPGTSGATTSIGQQGYAEERVPLKQLFGRIQVDERVLKAAKTNRGSFINVMNVETKGLAEDMKKDFNRQLFGDGSGIVVGIGTDAGGDNTVPLATATTRVQQRQVEIGMQIDIGTVADADVIADFRTVVGVSFAALPGTITVDGAALAATTDGTHFLYRAGLSDASAVGVEATGLAAIINNAGVLFNVDPATEPRWTSYVETALGAISELALVRLMNRVNYECGKDPAIFLTSDGVMRAYSASLLSQKRFVNTLDLKGGFKGLSVGSGNSEAALTDDRDCQTGVVYGINSEHLKLHVAGDWEWMDLDGAIWSRQPNKARYEATLFRFHELTTDRRNSFGKFTGVTEA